MSSPRAVHVWHADLDAARIHHGRLTAALSADEEARASRFRFSEDRRRFELARAILRDLLGRYLRVAPEEIRFDLTETGKPSLSYPASDLDFNLSHSSSQALYALCRGDPVGVDIEATDRSVEETEIVRRFFPEAEADEFDQIPQSRKRQTFFRLWTRREACLKARALGITGLKDLRFSLDVDGTPRLIKFRSDPTPPGQWTISEIDADAGSVAAVAVPCMPCNIRTFHWNEDATATGF